MSLVFTPTKLTPEGGNFLKGSNFFLLVGTITFSGSYAAGGDTFAAGKDPESILKQIGGGRILAVLTDLRGTNPEWITATKKLQLWGAAGTEQVSGAYGVAFTGSPAPVVILAR